MHITLYRKYRPKNFEEIAGQKEIVKTLKASLRNGKTSHAYLFTGPRGVGKTTIARLIAKGVNCLENGITDEPCNKCENCLSINDGSFMDMIEIDAASNRGIDEIRQLKEKINYQPSKGRKKIYIIDEVHMLTKEAFNALLKTLEEPPEHVIFILATTEADKILPTIISRCQRYDFKTLSPAEMKEKLGEISENEGVSVPDDVLDLIYENSGGSMRD
ncbi:MAG TPA: DNA polymerase III subunit gamma/tau, partial [Fusobacterium ulcerans]|nr:DNA polymerase III subunit gamma/tau [Fusobacterium ulcerans]